MNVRAYDVLEFGKVRDRLARLAESERGKAKALELEASTDPTSVIDSLALTSEARHLHDEGEAVSLAHLPDIEVGLDILRIEGRSLNVDDLMALAIFATVSEEVRARLAQRVDETPRLAARAEAIPELSGFRGDIERVIDIDEGEVRDNASEKLAALRSKSATLKKRLQRVMDSALSSRDNAKILQEAIVTNRNGRSVIPIKAECKSQFPGVVHGASASGATLFVEPMAGVEIGNEIASVQDQENEEVRRILSALTAKLRPSRPALSEASLIMTEIDLAQAKGRLSANHRGHAPEVTQSELRLVEARHPLLEGAVPVSFHVADGRRGLVFTGPNTGGKTVALKTAGLLSLMAQAGLHVPAAPGSSFPVFRSIFADIGDDQSIASNLSTFSAHLSKVVTMERELELPALVILDEVGTGTDPAEGGALGTALVEHFLERGALIIASTHHGLLKAYASTTEGIDAASFQFNPKTYEPTYEIVDGASGRSLAFEMAERLGLPRSIVARARELQSERERQVGQLVERLEAESADLEKAKHQVEKERRAAAAARARIEIAEDEGRIARRQGLDEFRQSLEDELENTRHELRELVAEAKRARTEQSTRWAALETTLSTKLDAIAGPLLAKARAETPANPARVPEPLEAGTRVLVASFGMEGELVRLVGGGEAEVLVRDKKLRLPVASLEALPVRERARSASPSRGHEPEPKDVPNELNLIGCTVEEALERADKFLDDAFLSEHREVRLIHGHGTGRLKAALREWLTSHAHVANQKSESHGGITVVELKD
jgi:DNA mismatch repair protein MutS2